MADLLKTDYKDEIKAQGVIKKQFKLVDALTGALLNGGNPIQLERSDTPSQKGSTLSAKDVNAITKAINLLLGTGWGDSIPPYTDNCLLFDTNNANKLMYYNESSKNKPTNSKAGIIIKLFISNSAYGAIAFDFTHMILQYVAYNPADKAWYGWYTVSSDEKLNVAIKDIKNYAKNLSDESNQMTNNISESLLAEIVKVANLSNNRDSELRSLIEREINEIVKLFGGMLTYKSVVIGLTGENFFNMPCPVGKHIIPLYFNNSSLYVTGINKPTNFVTSDNLVGYRINLNKAASGNVTMDYLLL